MSVLDAPYFRYEQKAFEKLESVLWPNGTICPKCGVVGTGKKIAANPSKKVRYGLYRCPDCKAQYTVTVGTVFESSHVPLHKWLQAAYMLCSSKKGMSSKQLERILQVTYKTAWFMSHRIREAMRDGVFVAMGGEGKIVEADETFIGTRKDGPKNPRGGHMHKMAVLSLVERGGFTRSIRLDTVTKREVVTAIRNNLRRETHLMTDSAQHYKGGRTGFTAHDMVNHTDGEYVRYTDGETIHTNTVEGFFSIFKRGMKGIYQHCEEKHLHRYLAEFDFRYNNREALGVDDVDRTANALRGARGKRLTYRRIGADA